MQAFINQTNFQRKIRGIKKINDKTALKQITLHY